VIEIGINDLISELSKKIVFVSSVNYERRSLESLKTINKIILNNSVNRQFHIYRLRVDNKDRRISILEAKAKSHEEEYDNYEARLKARIAKEGSETKIKDTKKTFTLDDLPGKDNIRSQLIESNDAKEPFSIVFDITALPRRVILLMMDVFVNFLEKSEAKNLFITYTWPGRYPFAGRSTNTGALFVENVKRRLPEFLDGVDEIQSIVTAGRDGSISRLFLESMPGNANTDTFFYIKKDDYLFGLNSILENANVLSFVDSNSRTRMNYFLSVSRGYELIISKVKETLEVWGKEHNNLKRALLIAPFGPKPMMITAYIAERYSRLFSLKNSLDCRSGIVHVSSIQQNDLYSIGYKNTSCYRISLDDLLGRKL